MLRKLIGNDLRNHVFLSVVTTLFMAICAMLLALTIMLFLNLSGAIDSLMEQAQTPDFLQMHAGEIDREALERFVEGRQDVEQWQVCGFLNLENGIIRLGEKTLEDSTQDNGLCVQGSGFDYLLDMENRLPDVRDGQIYAPVCYRAEYGVREGDAVWIGTREFVVAGFIRDSQMNSMMARPLNRQMRELYGTADAGAWIAVGTVLGALFIEGLLLLAISRLLKRMRRITALAALREGMVHAGQGGKRRCLPITPVVAAGAFLMVVPGKLYSTISAPQFVTYMGIGDGEVRLDVRQTENITGMTERLKELLDDDSRVEKSTVLVTKSFRLLEEDGGSSNLTVELGDHSVFPVTYSRGAAPRGDRELALSAHQGRALSREAGADGEKGPGESGFGLAGTAGLVEK